MIVMIGLGLVVGIIMALTGAGGGILAVPLLVFGLQMGVSEAGPVGLLAVGIAALIGAVLGLKDGIVRYRAALLMAGMGVVLSPAGVWLARRTDASWLNIIFAGVLLFVAWRTFRHADDEKRDQDAGDSGTLPCVRSREGGRFIWTTRCARALAISGGVAGLLSGLLGVGGGFVMVPSLKRYSDLNPQSIIATSLAVTAVIAASGVVVSASLGLLDWDVALPFAGGAVVGMLSGRFGSRYLQGAHLQKSFAVVAAAVAVGMVIKSLV